MAGRNPTAWRIVRALVTGCAGFIGSHLTEALLARSHSVVGIDCFNDNYGRAQKLRNLRHIGDWDSFEFVPIDLARGELRELIEGCSVVFHLAAEPGVRASWGSRYFQYVQNNVIATQHLLEAIKDRRDLKMVFASSSSVYGDAEIRPTPEDSPTRPLSPYGQTKLSAEQLCDLYRRNYGTAVVTLRYFTVFGPRQRPDMAFHAFCRAVLDNRPVTIFGDGLQTRDYTFVNDAVSATVDAGTREVSRDVYNIGGGSPTSLHGVTEILASIAGRRLEVVHAEPERGDVKDTAADTTAARLDLAFEPATSLELGLAREFEWVAHLDDDDH